MYNDKSPFFFHLPVKCLSNNRKGTYSKQQSTNPSSNPKSPVFLAIGPVNQTWLIDGTISPSERRNVATLASSAM